jgi:translin
MSLDTIGQAIQARLAEKHARRETLLGLSRRLTQAAARAIRALHRDATDEAVAALAEARELLDELNRTAEHYPDLESAGYTLDAQKEYAEAWLTRALLVDAPLPAPDELHVDDAAWLNGLGEAAGELRRTALDRIRRGDVAGAERVLAQMEDIYGLLCTYDFPSAITRDIKRTNDMVRGVTERTRGDLTVAARHEALRAALKRVEQLLPPPAKSEG